MKSTYFFTISSILFFNLTSCSSIQTTNTMKTSPDFTEKKCLPCEGLVAKYSQEEANTKLQMLGNDWQINQSGHLTKKYPFKDYISSQPFRLSIDTIAEKENHHPIVKYSWAFCEVEIFTFAVNGLTENDFTLAAKIEEAYNS